MFNKHELKSPVLDLNNQKEPFYCDCCKATHSSRLHYLLCRSVTKLRIHQHNYACNIITKKIKSKYNATLTVPKNKDLNPAVKKGEKKVADIWVPC